MSERYLRHRKNNPDYTYENMSGLGDHVPGNPPPKRGHEKCGDIFRIMTCSSRYDFWLIRGVGVGATVSDSER